MCTVYFLQAISTRMTHALEFQNVNGWNISFARQTDFSIDQRTWIVKTETFLQFQLILSNQMQFNMKPSCARLLAYRSRRTVWFCCLWLSILNIDIFYVFCVACEKKNFWHFSCKKFIFWLSTCAFTFIFCSNSHPNIGVSLWNAAQTVAYGPEGCP